MSQGLTLSVLRFQEAWGYELTVIKLLLFSRSVVRLMIVWTAGRQASLVLHVSGRLLRFMSHWVGDAV